MPESRKPRRSWDPQRAMLAIVGLGAVLRVALAALTDGHPHDIPCWSDVRHVLLDGRPQDAYSNFEATPFGELPRYAYPPGYMPFTMLAGLAESATGVGFATLIRLPAIAADLLLAFLVHRLLVWRGLPVPWLGAAIVLLAPSLVILSGWHAQIDTITIGLVLAALAVWHARGPRALVPAGLLIGTAITFKVTSVIGLVALLALAPTWRGRAGLLLVTGAVPLAALGPFLAWNARDTIASLSYGGVPGFGGLSLLVQPELATYWLGGPAIRLSELGEVVQAAQPVLVLASLAGAGWWVRRRRLDVWSAAYVVSLAVLLGSANFAVHYAVWPIVLAVAAGRHLDAVVLQAAILVPALLAYSTAVVGGWPGWVAWVVYVPAVAVFYVVMALLARRAPTPRSGTVAPTGPG